MTLLPTSILEHCYTDQTLMSIKDLFQQVGTTASSVHSWEGPNFGKTLSIKQKVNINDHPELKELILSGLPATIGELMITVECCHLRSFIPYEVHCDCGWLKLQDDESPFYVFIIPFETKNVNTISLNQTGYNLHFVDYKEHHDPLPLDQQMSEDTYQQYFSHCWPQERPYLSIDTVFKWQAGSVFMFDARRFHASDNYLSNGETEKNCIVLITKIKTQNLELIR
jgi:hypothetical protein